MFPFGGRSSFRDRSMGKSTDEIMDDMMKNIKQRKKEFMETPPKWRSMGMFDDGELDAPGGSRLQAHLGDLASRHPELAGHLSDLLPPSRQSQSATNPKDLPKAEPHKKSSKINSKSEVNPPSTATTGTQTGGGGGLESDPKLRSTVPDMQQSGGGGGGGGGQDEGAERGQRSQSAPPQAPFDPSAASVGPQANHHHHPGAYLNDEGVRIIPIRTDSPSRPQTPRQHQQKPPFGHQSQNHFGQQTTAPHHEEEETGGGGKAPTVRHIPIFVEGRDEPLISREPTTGGSTRGGCQGKAGDQRKQQQAPAPEQQKQQAPAPEQHPSPPPPPSSRQQSPPPPPSQHFQKPDPLQLVADVVREVEALRGKVSEWSGKSKADKDYIYLDEMLTRNLLKLDNIEAGGRDEVRSARKEAIRSIQSAISVLESKAAEGGVREQAVDVREETGTAGSDSQDVDMTAGDSCPPVAMDTAAAPTPPPESS